MRKLTMLALVLAFLFVPISAQAMTYTQAKRLSVSKVQTIIKAEAKKAHLSKANTAALLWICRRESNFHPTSKNPSGCYGLFQLSRGMSRYAPHGRWWEPSWNTRRAIKYMKGRYHSPIGAKNFWLRHSWY